MSVLFTNKYGQAQGLAHTHILQINECKVAYPSLYSLGYESLCITGAQKTSAEVGFTSNHKEPASLNVEVI